MKGKKRLRKIIGFVAGFRDRNGYIPNFLMVDLTGFSRVQDQIFVTRVLERKYPQVLAAIRAWELDADPGPDAGEPAPHVPGALKIKASGMTVQRQMESEMMFA